MQLVVLMLLLTELANEIGKEVLNYYEVSEKVAPLMVINSIPPNHDYSQAINELALMVNNVVPEKHVFVVVKLAKVSAYHDLVVVEGYSSILHSKDLVTNIYRLELLKLVVCFLIDLVRCGSVKVSLTSSNNTTKVDSML